MPPPGFWTTQGDNRFVDIDWVGAIFLTTQDDMTGDVIVDIDLGGQLYGCQGKITGFAASFGVLVNSVKLKSAA